MSGSPIRVLIVDDHAIVRKGIEDGGLCEHAALERPLGHGCSSFLARQAIAVHPAVGVDRMPHDQVVAGRE